MQRLRSSGVRRPVRLYVGATAFMIGLGLIALGSLSVVYATLSSVAAPGAAARWAASVTGVSIAIVLVVATLNVSGPLDRDRLLVGVALAIVGLALLWPLTPAGWAGDPLYRLLPAALVHFAGQFLLVVAFFTAAIGTEASRPSGHSTRHEPRSTDRVGDVPNRAVVDGGSDDEDLEFLLDEDDRKSE